MNLIATANFPYAGRRISKGEPFTISRQAGRILIALKKARLPVGDEPALSQEEQPADRVAPETAASATAAPISPRTGQPKRQYKRRDLKAEG